MLVVTRTRMVLEPFIRVVAPETGLQIVLESQTGIPFSVTIESA